jgi:hypothetical protein
VSTSTARALLVLPDPTETYAVTIVTANMTAIDGHLGFAPFTSATRPASAFSGRTIRETDTEKLYYSRGTVPISASWVQVLTANADAGLASSAALTFGGDSTINRLGAGSLRTLGAWRVEGSETVIGTTTASGAVSMNSTLTVAGSATFNGSVASSAAGGLDNFGGAWTSYTPSTTNITAGTGSSMTARYMRVGKLVFVQIQFILGTGASLTGNATFSLPVTARATTPILWGFGIAVDTSAGTGQRAIGVQVASTTTINFVNPITGGTVGTTNPFTWADADQIRVAFFYEAA